VLGSTVVAQLPGASANPESAVGAGAEAITLRLLYQLIVILLATRLVTAAVRRLGQTAIDTSSRSGRGVSPRSSARIWGSGRRTSSRCS
jgi:hypothetical protein